MKPQAFVRLAVVLISVCAGLYFLMFSHAAGAFIAAEPENGTLSSGAASVSDSTASGSKAVKFSSSTAGLLWSDEFDGPAGSLVNSSKWGYESGYVRNNEL